LAGIGLIALALSSAIRILKVLLKPQFEFSMTKKGMILKSSLGTKTVTYKRVFKDFLMDKRQGWILLRYRKSGGLEKMIVHGLSEPEKLHEKIVDLTVEKDHKESDVYKFSSRANSSPVLNFFVLVFSTLWLVFNGILLCGLLGLFMKGSYNRSFYGSLVVVMFLSTGLSAGAFMLKESLSQVFTRNVLYILNGKGMYIEYTNFVRFIAWKEFTNWARVKGRNIFMNGPYNYSFRSRSVSRERISMLGVENAKDVAKVIRKYLKAYNSRAI
jgi:hypothetical protein